MLKSVENQITEEDFINCIISENAQNLEILDISELSNIGIETFIVISTIMNENSKINTLILS